MLLKRATIAKAFNPYHVFVWQIHFLVFILTSSNVSQTDNTSFKTKYLLGYTMQK